MSVKATKESYSLQAKAYEDKWEKYLAHTHKMVLQELKLPADAEILDVSAGTGLFQQRLLDRGISFKKMVLNDLSEGMLEVAKSRFSSDDRFTFSHQKAEELHFPDDSFDVIFSVNAFHNYGDQEKVIEEWSRVLRPGGKLYLLDWNKSGWFKLINSVISIMVPEIINTRSALEVEECLTSRSFKTERRSEWWFTWWKFYFLKATKVSSSEE